MAADVVGYSRLMGANEVATLTSLKGHRAELIDPAIADHQGRIVKLTGDGILIEFPSVVNAVDCAAEVQRGMRQRNADIAIKKMQIIIVMGHHDRSTEIPGLPSIN